MFISIPVIILLLVLFGGDIGCSLLVIGALIMVALLAVGIIYASIAIVIPVVIGVAALMIAYGIMRKILVMLYPSLKKAYHVYDTFLYTPLKKAHAGWFRVMPKNDFARLLLTALIVEVIALILFAIFLKF